MRSVSRWRFGSPETRAAVEAWLSGALPGVELRDNPRRRIVRLDLGAGHALVLKLFRTASGRHAMRERWKARVGLSPAAREARALREASRGGAPVAEALGLARLDDGDVLLALRLVGGMPLSEALRRAPRERRQLLRSLGRAMADLHRAGLAHGDLHHGNVLVADDRPILLDLQHARALTRERALRDAGFLEHSLRPLVSAPDRVRVLRAALGLSPRPTPRDRASLRGVLAAGDARAREHARSRTRRALRPGRAYAALAHGAERGLRVRELPEDVVLEALRRHRAVQGGGGAEGARVLTGDGRSRVSAVRVGSDALVVKEVLPRGGLRPLADLVRGSPGRRAWRAGHGLLFRGIGAARPLAYLERRRLGLPIASVVLLEDLSADRPADRAALEAPDDFPPAHVVETLGRVAIALHRQGVLHDDLKASHVLLRATPRGLEARLIDLEGLRLDAALSETARLRALAQLNASLPDALPAAARHRAFLRYARALPFAAGEARALRRVVQQSLARQHRWSGAGCALAPRARR
ncbi:MAG TPA: lipopolysaccharide kinase InaA family protein [Myxococcota bacterium]|nr:lipopolysaccharide kinase InaA family protein [Myxococcota bacterium]